MLSFHVPKIIFNTKIIEVYIEKCICNCTTSMTAIDTNKETCCQTIICIWLPAYGLLNRERNLWRVVHLLKYSLILSLETFSGRFPTHRWRVSLTIAPANHRCWHPGGLPHPLTSPSSTSRHLKHSPHSLTSSRAVTDVRAPSPRRRPLRPSRPLSSLLVGPAVATHADFSQKKKDSTQASFVSGHFIPPEWHHFRQSLVQILRDFTLGMAPWKWN